MLGMNRVIGTLEAKRAVSWICRPDRAGYDVQIAAILNHPAGIAQTG